MEYRVIINDEYQSFIKNVNSFLQEGWECLGGVSISYNNEKLTYTQAIIKTT